VIVTLGQHNVSSHVYLCLWSRPSFYACFPILIYHFRCTWFWIYYWYLISIYVIGQCLYLHAWNTSLDHVHVWLPMHANWLHLTYSLGYFLTTLDLHVQIQEPGPWWAYCSWSECTVEAWISGCLSEASFLLAPFDWLAKFSSCYSWVFFNLFNCISCFALLGNLIFLEYCIMPCDNVYMYYYYWNVYYHCAFIFWFLPVLILSVYMWEYFHLAYIHHSNISIPAGSGHYIFIRILLALVQQYDLELEQLDMKTAFLHRDLDEKIFMTKLLGFKAAGKEILLYKLKKPVYRLKKLSRQWYK